MAKVLKATWVGTPAGGGVSIQAFEEFKESRTKLPNGSTQRSRERESITVTVMPSRENETFISDDLILGEKRSLSEGDFYVQETPKNMKVLEGFVKAGMVEMDDLDLHYKLLDAVAPPKEVEKIVDSGSDVIVEVPPNSIAAKEEKAKELKTNVDRAKAEKQAVLEEEKKVFDSITCITRGRDDVLEEMIEKGVTSLERLAEVDADVLVAIKGVGAKLARNMKEQALGLLE